MRWTRTKITALVAGATLLAGAAAVAAQESPPPVDPPARGEDVPHGLARGHGKHPGHALHRAIRGEVVLPTDEEGVFRTVRTDRGILREVDTSTLRIEEADGEVVEIPTSDDTRIHRDGEEAELGDLQIGDHVQTMRERSGDEDFATRFVRAVSAERYEELEAQREACREDRQACRQLRRERIRERRNGEGPPARSPAQEAGEVGLFLPA